MPMTAMVVLGGQGDLVSRLLAPVTHKVTLIIPILKFLSPLTPNPEPEIIELFPFSFPLLAFGS